MKKQNNYLLSHNLDSEIGYYEYDAHGNMIQMPHLQEMQYDYADQLHEVTLNSAGNKAYYVYDAEGNRVRKVVIKSGKTEQRFYVGDYELFIKEDTERETLKIQDDKQVVALVEKEIHSSLFTFRYQLTNHLDSASLELDENANIISYEEYHPFGTTSYRSGRSESEVSLKRYKYVFKELDNETGLYYYGMRYYASWIARFISVDPLQFEYPYYTPFQYAGNKPVSYIDLDGAEPRYPGKTSGEIQYGPIVASGSRGSRDSNNYSWSWNENHWNKQDVIKSSFKNFSAKDVESQVFDRSKNYEKINQRSTGLCGTVVCAQSLAKYDSAGYYKMAMDLYTTGTATYENYTIKAGNHIFNTANNYYSKSKMVEADWILLASMRDYENTILDYGDESFKFSNEFTGITSPSEVKGILDKMGFNVSFNSMDIIFTGVVDNDISRTMNLFEDSHKLLGATTVMLINTEGAFYKRTWSAFPSHYVLYDPGKLSINNSNQTVSYSVSTWGDFKKLNNIPFESFKDGFFGAIIINK